MLEILSPYFLPAGAIAAAVAVGHFGTARVSEWWAASKAKKAMAQLESWGQAQGAAVAPQLGQNTAHWLAHPVQTLQTWEHQMAQEAATLATNAIAHLADVSPQDANIALQNDIKAFKAKLLAEAISKLQPPAAS